MSHTLGMTTTRLLVGAGILVALPACAFWMREPRTAPPEVYVRSAVRELRNGETDKALDVLLRARERFPSSEPVLRWLADEAGVHFYIDTPDLVWANEEMVSICVDQPGERKVRLPQACAVKDLYENKSVTKGSKSFSADFEDKSTKVFLLTPRE